MGGDFLSEAPFSALEPTDTFNERENGIWREASLIKMRRRTRTDVKENPR